MVKQEVKLRIGSLGPLFSYLLRVQNAYISLRSAAGLNTFKPEHNILYSFSLFLENWLSLPTIIIQLPVKSSFSGHIENPYLFVYGATLWGWCLPYVLQKVQQVLGTFTMLVGTLSSWKESSSTFSLCI